jgi:hypothetical protein
MARLHGLVLALLATACGSRSGLLEGAATSIGGASGNGGAVTGGSGGTSGTGASGGTSGTGASGGLGGTGGVFACNNLTEVQPRQSVDHPGTSHDRNPKLALSANDNPEITVVFTRQPGQGATRKLEHATFGCASCQTVTWPASGQLVPTFETFSSPDLSEDFRVGGGDQHYSAIVEHSVPGAPDSPILSFVPAIDAWSSNTGPNTTINGMGPGFVAYGQPNRYLVATHLTGALSVQNFSGLDPSGAAALLGCADAPVVGDALRMGDVGWLVAYSNAGNAPVSGCSGVDPGPPTRIDVSLFDDAGNTSYVLGFDAGAPVDRIVLARHAQDAWIVYRVASGGAIPPIRWALIDAQGGFKGEGDVTGPADVPLAGFDATGLATPDGQRLVVAWGNDPGDSPPDIALSMLSDSGDKLVQMAFEPPSFGELSIAALWDGKLAGNAPPGVYVAWSEQSGAQDDVVRVARFECAP